MQRTGGNFQQENHRIITALNFGPPKIMVHLHRRLDLRVQHAGQQGDRPTSI